MSRWTPAGRKAATAAGTGGSSVRTGSPPARIAVGTPAGAGSTAGIAPAGVPALGLLAALLLVLAAALPAGAYPEFEAWVEETSGRYVNCALCHTHPDGPEGVKPGQIRSLSREELERLNRARRAFEPGHDVDSPVLNDFGDLIVEELGKRRFLEIRSQDPALLVDALGTDSDLDGDGIPDAVEYREGTHPLDPRHGAPLRLLRHNLGRHWFDILMIVLATVAGLWGLDHLLAWAARRRESEERAEERPTGGGVIPS